MNNSVYMTKKLAEDLAADSGFHIEVLNALLRYMEKDYGDDLSEADKSSNENALKNGGQLIAAYHTSRGNVLIITDDTKSAKKTTTVLYASEY